MRWNLLRATGKFLLPVFVFAAALIGTPAWGEASADEFASAVVRIDSVIAANGNTVSRLGATRSGSAVVIDASGLLVTAGYLVLEAESVLASFNSGEKVNAEILANDLDSGLALLRVALPEGISAMPVGNSASTIEGDSAVVLSFGGTAQATVTTLSSVRPFIASWEYGIERAFYTSPPHRAFSGAALVNRDAELIGIGSLLLGNIYPDRDDLRFQPASGNVFIPVELLTANLGSLLTGSTIDSRAWLGVYLQDGEGEVVIQSLASSGPAQLAGVQPGDQVLAINRFRVQSMAQLYNTLWAAIRPGDPVTLTLVRDGRINEIEVVSGSRGHWLRKAK